MEITFRPPQITTIAFFKYFLYCDFYFVFDNQTKMKH